MYIPEIFTPTGSHGICQNFSTLAVSEFKVLQIPCDPPGMTVSVGIHVYK